jgi:LDH2 family malate/lactate/ureidoglycolate dehydrogenase
MVSVLLTSSKLIWTNGLIVLKAAPAVDGKNVIIPGDPERELEAERKANGINLLEPVVNDLNALATRFGIKF